MKVGLLLAAGLSTRFAGQNKLLAPLRGKPLVTHAASVLDSMDLDHLIAVTADREVERHLKGFEIVHHPHPEQGQGTSLALGAQTASRYEASRLLVLLADMPFVTQAHCGAVLRRCTDVFASASLFGERPMPPACFPASMLTELSQRTGDEGARQLIAALPPSALVEAPGWTLDDIDTADDLARHERQDR